MPFFCRDGHQRVSQQAGRVKSWASKYCFLKWLFPITGLTALVWFLIRVIPKPSRATYPCQRVAFPLASGFVVWVLGLAGSLAAYNRGRRHLSRARFLVAGLCAAVSIGLIWAAISSTADRNVLAVPRTPQPANQPIGVAKGICPGRVVWIRDADATDWVYTDKNQTEHWYQPQHTDQVEVSRMLSRAIRALVAKNTDAEAWDAIFRYFNQQHDRGDVGYAPGEKIGIKINHTLSCGSDPCVMDKNPTWGDNYMNYIDNSPQLTIALLEQLTEAAGVAPGDISIGDPSRITPNYWYDMVEANCPGVVYVALWGGLGRTQVQFDTNAPFYWSTPDASGKVQDYVPTCFSQADYFINFPVMKSHLMGGITVCGKNLYGSLIRTPVGDIRGTAYDYYSMHDSLPDPVEEMGSYRALVDLMTHPKMAGKTLLYLVDGLFAGEGWDGVPSKWTITPFSNDWPSSIFLSQDGVAVDSVCFDFLLAQWPKDPGANMSGSDDYLHELALIPDPCSGTNYDPNDDGGLTESFGTHEHWNDVNSKEYSRNIDPLFGTGIELVTDTIVGDLDGDGDVDWVDFAYLASLWNTMQGDPGWDPGCDISEPGDGVIDLADIGVFCENWLEGTVLQLVDPDAELVEVYAEEGTYFEGPSWDPVTAKLYFTDRTYSRIMRLDGPGTAAVWMNSAPGTNGTFIANNGRLLTADEDTKQIRSHRIGAAGPEDSQVLAGPAQGIDKMPNDLCQTANGNIYFSGPDWSTGPNNQGVYLLRTNGTVTRVNSGLYQPNGVIASNDGKRLYVAESSSSDITKKRWWVYPINPDGTLGTGIVFFKPESPPSTNDPDGMTIDEYGNVYFAGLGGIWICSPRGRELAMIPVPEFCSNVTFGGPDGRTLYITCQDKVYALAMLVRGGMWVDEVAPAPNPMAWSDAPGPSGPYSIEMTAATAGDTFGVEYYFYNQTDPTHDSGWQDSPYYEDNALQRDVMYTYRVKARDKSDLGNETAYSSPASSTTETQAPPIAFDAASSAASTSTGSTLSWQHTIGSGQNRILVVGTQSENPSGSRINCVVNNIRYNGASFAKAGSKLIDTNGRAMAVEMWYLRESSLPAAGTYTIQVTYTGPVESRTAGAISVANCFQGSPEDSKTASATTSPISTTVTSSAGAWVIDAVGCGNVSGFTPAASGMAERYDVSATSNEGAGSTRPVDTAGAVTMTWTNNNVDRMAQVAASFAALP